ncbi:MAG: protein-L-isoaspartate(D-aspartate) O-methyltransferase [Myxococcota bacterium]
MNDYEKEREEMVERQIAGRGIKDPGVLFAMRKVERHLFVPEEYRRDAYDDRPLPIGHKQTISQPYMVAAMTDELKVGKSDVVFEVGTGSGYQTAILAELASTVITIERIESLYERAKRIFKELSYGNIICLFGDGSAGARRYAPFDRILITAASERIPGELFNQLAEGGRMVMPLGGRFAQTLVTIEKIGGEMAVKHHFDCVFVPLKEGTERYEH